VRAEEGDQVSAEVRATMPRKVLLVTQWLQSCTPVTEICGTRISYRLDGTYPAIRVADVGPIERGPEEVLQRIQIECWAEDYDTAEQLALAVEAVVATARGEWPAGYCAGGDVDAGPYFSPDPQSERFRHQLDLALWFYPGDVDTDSTDASVPS
jgi:hypothetical protein